MIIITFYYKLNELIPLHSSFLFFSSHPAGHSSSNKAWKIGCLVLALLLASAIVVIIYMCYKCCKVPVTHAPQGDAVNNRNGIFYRNHKYWTEGQHHNDEDDDEMLNI